MRSRSWMGERDRPGRQGPRSYHQDSIILTLPCWLYTTCCLINAKSVQGTRGWTMVDSWPRTSRCHIIISVVDHIIEAIFLSGCQAVSQSSTVQPKKNRRIETLTARAKRDADMPKCAYWAAWLLALLPLGLGSLNWDQILCVDGIIKKYLKSSKAPRRKGAKAQNGYHCRSVTKRLRGIAGKSRLDVAGSFQYDTAVQK